MHTGEPPASPIGSGTGAPVRILAVDDDPTSRMLTRATLEDHLGKVTEAENGLLAVQTLERQEFDLAIVDLDMPVMDGLAAAEEVERKGIPVILVSGHPDSESVVLDEEPVITRITKPASIDRIKEAIALAMASRVK